LRVVIGLAPAAETQLAARAREARRAWLAERGYRIVNISTADVEADIARVLDVIASALAA